MLITTGLGFALEEVLTLPGTDIEQYCFGNGPVLNTDVSLPFVDVETVQGLDNAPVRSQTHDRDGTDGGYVDAEFETIRTVTLEGTIYTAVGAFESFMDQLKACFAPTRTSVPLTFTTDAGTRFVMGKSQGIRYDKDSGRRLGIASFQVQIICEDPRIYSVELAAARAALAQYAMTGRGYNKSYDFGYGPFTQGNSCNLVLKGNRESPGQMTLVGPVLNPGIVNDTLGITMNFGLTLADTDSLIIDLNTRSVLLNGTANRRSALQFTSGGWYMFQPGSNTLRMIGSPVGVGNAALLAQAYPAWR
jgi:tail protein